MGPIVAVAGNFVWLQGASPGVEQAGHVNLGGDLRVGGNLTVVGTVTTQTSETVLGDITADGNLKWKSGTANIATLDHANAQARTYTFPDSDLTIVGTVTTQTLANKTLDNTNILTVKDANFTLQGSLDATKQAQFDLSTIATGITRVYKLPDSPGTVALLERAQTFTAAQRIDGTLIVSVAGPHAIGGETSSNIQLGLKGTFPAANNPFAFQITSDITAGSSSIFSAGFIDINASVNTSAAAFTLPDIAGILIRVIGGTVGAGSTITNATSLKIVGAPIIGTNRRALWVVSGLTEFGGQVKFGSTTVLNTVTYTWPAADGTSGQQLQTDGAGTLSWAAASSLREYKNIIREWDDPQTALQAVLNAKFYDFTYRPGFGTGDYNTIYTGVMADEDPWAMHHKRTIFSSMNAFSYTALSIQALHERIEQLEAILRAS